MRQKQTLFMIAHYTLLVISAIAITIVDYSPKNSTKFWICLILTIILYILSIIFGFFGWFYSYYKSDNPPESIKHRSIYFDKVGYGLFTGGLVSLTTSDFKIASIGLIIIGLTSIIIGNLYNDKLEKHNDSLPKA